MSFLKRFVVWPFIAGLLLLFPIAIVIFILNFIYQNLVRPLADFSFLVIGNGWVGPAITVVLVYLLGLILHFWPIEKLLARFSYLKIVSKIKKGGRRFPEVAFKSYGDGRYLKGVKMGNSRLTVPGEQTPIVVHAVWEPRPLSITGRMHWLRESDFTPTGRSGWELIVEVFTYSTEEYETHSP